MTSQSAVSIQRIVLIASLLSILLINTKAQAGEEEFKDAIWNDCKLAISEAAKFNAEERGAAVGFLTGIINLDLANAAENNLVNPGLIKAPDGIMSDVSLAQSLDPERPNRAKKCVADILPILLPESEQALPALLVKSEDLTINDEVRAAFARVAFNLAQLISAQILPTESKMPSSKSGLLSEAVFDELFRSYLEKSSSQQSSLREEVLLLFPPQLISSISSNLKSSGCVLDCSKESELAGLFSKMDLQSSASRESVMSLLTELRADLQGKVLQSLQHSTVLYELLLSFILSNFEFSQVLNSPSNPERNQLIQNLNTIFDFELRSSSLAVDPKLRLGLIAAFESSSVLERDVFEKGLAVIAPLFPEFTSSLKPLVVTKDPDIRARAARLLSRVSSPSKETKKLISTLLADPSIYVQQVALASSLSTSDSKTLLALAASIQAKIKKQLTAKQLTVQQALDFSLELLRTVSQITTSGLATSWSRVALECIEAGIIQNRDPRDLLVATTILQGNPSSTLTELRAFARSQEISKRNAAIFVLQRAVVTEASIYELLLNMLSDTEQVVSKNAQIALLTLTSNLAELLSQKRTLAPSPRLDELFLEAGLRLELASEIQRRMQEVSCTEISELAGACLPRNKLGDFCIAATAQIPRCIESGIIENLPKGLIEKALSLQPQIKDVFNQTLFNSQTKLSTQLAIGLFLLRAKSANEAVISKLCGLASIASDSAMAEITAYVSLDLLSIKNCLTVLGQQFEDPKVTGIQKAQLFNYILTLDKGAIDVSVIVKDALERKDLAFLRVLAQGELVNEILPILGQVLADNNVVGEDQDKIVSLQLIEELGEKATSQLPAVLPLLEARSNEVRYRAARAIISSNLDQATGVRALRSIINSVHYRDLLLSHNLNGLTTLTESLLNNPAFEISSLERRDLLKLLRELRGPNAVVPEPLEIIISDEKRAVDSN